MSASGKSSTVPPADLERELDELYALELSEFVRRRDELARQLKGAGDRETSEAVGALAKATVPAWVVNRLALESSASWQRLLDAGEGLRAAQQSGGGDELRDAQQERREALDRLLDEAETVLRESPHAASQGTLERVRRTLETVAVYGRSGLLPVRPGRLTRELDPPGFEVLATLSALPARPRKGRVPGPKGRSPKPRQARGKAGSEAGHGQKRRPAEQARREREADLRRALRRAEARLETARAREAEDESRAAELRSTLAAMQEELERRRLELATLEKEEQGRRGKLESAREKLDRSRSRREELEREVERARGALNDDG